MPAAIQGGLWEGLKRRCGVLSFQQPQLVDDVFGVADLTEPPEDIAWQQGWNRRFHSITVAAGGAGQYGTVGLRYTGPKILVIEGLWAAAAGLWEVDATGADAGTIVGPVAGVVELDWRQLPVPSSTPTTSTDASPLIAGTSGAAPAGFRVLGLVQGFNPFNFVLTSGAGGFFAFKNTTANVAVTLGFMWRERTADAMELQR